MQLILSALVALTLTAGPVQVLDPSEDGMNEGLVMPDDPPSPARPGADLFGPGGPGHDLFPQIPGLQGRRPRPPEAAAPQAPPPDQSAKLTPDERRKARIEDLFGRLAGAKDDTEADALLAMLDRIWLQSGSDTADLLMSRAVTALVNKDYPLSETLLDKIVTLEPDWAEAWNKRATVHYLQDDDVDSMTDISHVLTIEPRHVGALTGMGLILHRNGNDKSALTVLRRAAAVDPRNKLVNDLIEQLSPDVDGRDL